MPVFNHSYNKKNIFNPYVVFIVNSWATLRLIGGTCAMSWLGIGCAKNWKNGKSKKKKSMLKMMVRIGFLSYKIDIYDAGIKGHKF